VVEVERDAERGGVARPQPAQRDEFRACRTTSPASPEEPD
jgi:hypothetical protein